ncbi:hypothetical protein GLYMA_13G264766v4 [Glycine max]|nr:hypothetical protein GLYMA_13G264766v4 [Glycine max]KAH1103518.1 hypothetical protein GYH30_037459 [Glycine max]
MRLVILKVLVVKSGSLDMQAIIGGENGHTYWSAKLRVLGTEIWINFTGPLDFSSSPFSLLITIGEMVRTT